MGTACEEPLGSDGHPLRLLPEAHCAVVHFVWGMHASPTRAFIDGKPLSASLDESQPLLHPSSQAIIADLCIFPESA